MRPEELRQLPEEWLGQQLIGEAKAAGWLAHHVTDSRLNLGDAGFPDWVLARAGRLIIVELKTEVGRLSQAQNEWLRQLGERPMAETHVWRPRDFDTRHIRGVLA